jgi:RHS repeat-associated protein
LLAKKVARVRARSQNVPLRKIHFKPRRFIEVRWPQTRTAYRQTAADYDGVVSGRTFYMQQRYYDPVAARFLSLDPVTTDANTGSGFNLFNYANNNPYRFTDPDGRAANTIIDETHLGRAAPEIAPRGIDGTPVRQSLEGARANLAEARSQLKENVANGNAGAAQTELKLGDKVAGKEVTFKTSDGTRTRTDFVTNEVGGKGAVESKNGNARLSTGQEKFKADVDAGRAVVPVGKNAAAAGLTPGQPTTLVCCQIDRTLRP